jgi:6-pyruvoyltetrahydropterin/6-carboxytetrahydropterin synthase
MTKFEVGVMAHFRASHALRGDFGPATVPHEHDYRVEAIVRGSALRPDGTLCDIAVLERALGDAVAELRGASLDALPAFRRRNSTAEEVAAHLAQGVRARVDGAEALVVRVWESPEAYASCELGP